MCPVRSATYVPACTSGVHLHVAVAVTVHDRDDDHVNAKETS